MHVWLNCNFTVARDDLENKLGESVISNKNVLDYEYVDNPKLIENK